MDASASTELVELIEIDRHLVGLATANPGISAADAVRRLLGRWTGPYLRARIDLLDARGLIHAERRSGRVYIHPAFPGVE